MTDKPAFEFPEAVRELAERNVEQARSAYGQFLEISRQAQELLVRSSGSMLDAGREMQKRVMRFTEENMEAGFAMATELARARDLKDYLEIQTRHAQRQAFLYTQQAQELGRLMAEAAQKAQPKM